MNYLKDQQRRIAYDARNAQIDKDDCSRIICDRFIAHPAYKQAETVMWYIHCRSEVRTAPALLRELERTTGKRIVIPYCTKDDQGNNKLGLWWLEDFTELVPGMWDILVCFESQLFEKIAKEPHDVAMDTVITERMIYTKK